MKYEEYKALILTLAYEWVSAKLPGERISYGNCMELIGELLAVTRDIDRTRSIFIAVLNQAIKLNKTSTWVEHELSFEVMVTIFEGSRLDALTYDLTLTPFIEDQALDLFNERMKRFM